MIRVAMLAPIAWRTPPRQYGPWEQVTSCITESLVKKGVDVTLFATGDSLTTAKLAFTSPLPYAEDPAADAKVNECLHISHLMERADEFDLIHNNFDFLPLTYSGLISTPMLTTIHGFSSPRIIPVYKKYNNATHYVSISDSNRHKDLDYIATVYNGVDQEKFSYREVPADYLLFFGRIHPEKGTLEAIKVAKRTGHKLVIAGLIQDEQYFDNMIRPLIDDDQIRYVGNADPAQRDELLGGAIALLHLISFDEPFGLSVAEAMCCGTPVVAFNRGSMPELIRHEETGFLVADEDAAVTAIADIHRISRATCSQWARSMFSQEKMTEDYLAVYARILAG